MEEQNGLIYDEEVDRIIYRITTRFAHREGKTISRKVSFLDFITLLGKSREIGIEDLAERLNQLIGTGKWLFVTNMTEIRMLKEVSVYDSIVGNLITTSADEYGCGMRWEFYRIDPFEKTLVAVADQETTWTKVIDGANIEKHKMPDWMRIWLERQMPLGHNPSRVIPPIEEYTMFPEMESGEILFEEKPCLYEMEFLTTTLNSNYGGNVYYQNYFEWQINILDHFFYSIAPEIFTDLGKNGELMAVRSRIDYLRDVIPFETIKMQLLVKALGKSDARFEIVYYKKTGAFDYEKAAVGALHIVFVKRDESFKPVVTPWPQQIYNVLSGQDLAAGFPFHPNDSIAMSTSTQDSYSLETIKRGQARI